MGGSEKSFRMSHIKTVQQYADAGRPVVITVQTVSGTAWQKTAYRVMAELVKGSKTVAILTNECNPELDKLRQLVLDINTLVKGGSVVMQVLPMRTRQPRNG